MGGYISQHYRPPRPVMGDSFAFCLCEIKEERKGSPRLKHHIMKVYRGHAGTASLILCGELVTFMLRLGKKPQYQFNLVAKRKVCVIAEIELCTYNLKPLY
jgi:hypothetical protein